MVTPTTPLLLTRGSPETQDEVSLRLERWGSDYLLWIYGGERHVGAVVLVEGEWCRSISSPGHMEEPLALEAARRVAPLLRGGLTVLAGIHYDDISREAIKRIVHSVEEMSEELSALLSAPEN